MEHVEAGVKNFRAFQIRASDFFTGHEAVEAERDKQQQQRHAENGEKLTQIANKVSQKSLWVAIAGVCVAIAGVAVSVLAILATVRLAMHSEIDPLRFFHSQSANPVVSSSQTVDLPPTYAPQ